MTEYTGVNLAIKVAERCGDRITPTSRMLYINHKQVTWDEYLHDKAAEILFSEGMPGEIDAHLYAILGDGTHGTGTHNIAAVCWIRQWWATLTKEKLLNVWLELLEIDK